MEDERYDYSEVPDFDGGTYLHLGNIDVDPFRARLDELVRECRPAGRDEAGAMLARLRAIGPTEVMRCFNPGFGLALTREGTPVWWCAICFSCNWIRINDGAFPFDGDSTDARAILAIFHAIFPAAFTDPSYQP